MVHYLIKNCTGRSHLGWEVEDVHLLLYVSHILEQHWLLIDCFGCLGLIKLSVDEPIQKISPNYEEEYPTCDSFIILEY